jgi:hypothetical protein
VLFNNQAFQFSGASKFHGVPATSSNIPSRGCLKKSQPFFIIQAAMRRFLEQKSSRRGYILDMEIKQTIKIEMSDKVAA